MWDTLIWNAYGMQCCDAMHARLGSGRDAESLIHTAANEKGLC